MDRKKLMIFSATGIVIVLLALIGITYGYYVTRIVGNTNKNSIYVTSATLALEYSEDEDSSINLTNIQPGITSSKSFTITNVGNATVDSYGIYLEEVINTFARTDDLQITLSCKEYNAKGTFVKNCNSIEMSYPTTNQLLITNSIQANYSHVYTFTFEYIYLSDIDQSEDIGKTLSGLIQVYNEPDVITLTGKVTGYSNGDYIEINSVPKISKISSKGTYTLTAMGLGEHTIILKNSNGNTKSSQKIKISKNLNGNSSINSNGSSIVIAEDSTYAVLNLNYSGNLTLSGIEISNEELVIGDTFAKKIIANAKSASGTRTIYSETPKTTPGQTLSTSTERTLSTTDDVYTATTGNKSYYFRGNVDDNYVTFANMCWRIVRIQGDGSVKLILADEFATCSDAITNKTNSGYITAWQNYAETYTYSEINSVLNSWYAYSTELKSYESKYLKKENWYNGDDGSKVGVDSYVECTDPYYNGSSDCPEYRDVYVSNYFAAAHRLINQSRANLNTSNESSSSSFIGILNADEVAFAGSIYGNRNASYYLSYNAETNYWWTSSLAKDGENNHYFVVNDGLNAEYGNGLIIGGSGYTVNAVRPVIVLKDTVLYKSGDGTVNNPYQVK